MLKPKVKFIYFSMYGCSHCYSFEKSPKPETSVWSKLQNDPELRKLLEFNQINFGNQHGINRKLPIKYYFVEFAPYFCLENGERTSCISRNIPRTYDTIKNWILENLNVDIRVVAELNTNPPDVVKSYNNENVVIENNVEKDNEIKSELVTIEDILCPICLSVNSNSVIIPCGHTLCETCSKVLQNCHICRGEISKVMKIYFN